MKDTVHRIAEFVRAFSGVKKSGFTSAIIVAGGSGTRFSAGGAEDESAKTKQLTEVAGVPVVVRTLLAFESCPDIDSITVAARDDEVELYSDLRERYRISKLSCVTPGGSTRQESVMKAFSHIPDETEFVAIHDAARCCVTPEMITAVLREAERYDAAAAGHRVTDTVKYEDGRGFIESTVDRERVWLVSTPQIFKVELYRACAFAAKRDGISVTDDCGLLEAQGFRVKLTDVGGDNIKLTHREDIARAEKILSERGKAK